MEIRKCPKCGAEIPITAKFCKECGAPIVDMDLSKKEVKDKLGIKTSSDKTDILMQDRENAKEENGSPQYKWWMKAPVIIVLALIGTSSVFFLALAVTIFIFRLSKVKQYKGINIFGTIASGLFITFCCFGFLGQTMNSQDVTSEQKYINGDELNQDKTENVEAKDINDNVDFTGIDIDYILNWDYPKLFKREREELFDFMKSIDGMNIDQLEYIEKAFIDDVPGFYYGEKENNQPDGIGIILIDAGNSEYSMYVPQFVGHFKNGHIDGYGILFEEKGGIIREGNFNYEVFPGITGDGIIYYKGNKLSYAEDQEEKDLVSKVQYKDNTIVLNYPVLRPSVQYEGEFDEEYNELIGDGKQWWNNYQKNRLDGKYYRMNDENCYGPLMYDGEFKYGKPDGDGVAYFLNGKKMYKGSFSEGNFDGKGAAYSMHGHLIGKGEFENGMLVDGKTGSGIEDMITEIIDPEYEYDDVEQLYRNLIIY